MTTIEQLAAMIGSNNQPKFPWANVMCPGLHTSQCYCKGQGYFPNSHVHAEDMMNWLWKQGVEFHLECGEDYNDREKKYCYLHIDDINGPACDNPFDAILEGILEWAKHN